MSKRARPIPQLLGKKLKKIRLDAEYRQYQMRSVILPDIEADEYANAPIPDYELGRRAPSYPEIIRYADFGKVSLEYLIDDSIPLDAARDHPPLRLVYQKRPPQLRFEIARRIENLEKELQELKEILAGNFGA